MYVNTLAAVVNMFINFVYLLCVLFLLRYWKLDIFCEIYFGAVQLSVVRDGFELSPLIESAHFLF